MIRYVLAVLVAVAIVAVSLAAIDYGAAINGERQVESQIAAIDAAATSLLANEELPPRGQPSPQRIETVVLPADSLTSTPVDDFRIVRVDANASVAVYRLEGGPERRTHLDAPIVDRSGDPVEFGGAGTETAVRLTLERDPAGGADRPIVVLSRV